MLYAIRLFFLNSFIISVLTVIFGFLYIPAFMYGYFWLWVFAFTAISILFVRSMIDTSIERVSKKGDEAAQAKAMIPEFLMMNVKMTILMSFPFIATLFLLDHGYIDKMHMSEADRAIWVWCLWVLKSSSRIALVDLAVPQIVLSAFFFMMICTVSLFAFARQNIKRLFDVLFHKESYKFLQVKFSTAGDLNRFLSLVFIFMYLASLLFTSAFSDDVTHEIFKIVFVAYLIFGQVCLFFATEKIREVRWKNLS